MKFYVSLIYTNSYSGNFEREMTAFCTGIETPRGSEYIRDHVDPFWKQNSFAYNIEQNEDHWEEECAIFPNPDYRNNGYGLHVKNVGKNKDKYKWPAFMTVGIFTIIKPSEQQLINLKKKCN